jgi:hypothetical protein
MGLGVLEQTAWLFAREHESVYMRREQNNGVWQLHVYGPGEQATAHQFGDAAALSRFQESLERNLLASGFHLQARAERRSGHDRRSRVRPSTRDRRRD